MRLYLLYCTMVLSAMLCAMSRADVLPPPPSSGPGPIEIKLPPVIPKGRVEKIERIEGGLHHPTALAFLPSGAMLVAERAGGLLRLDPNSKPQRVTGGGITGLHTSCDAGILDIAVKPPDAAGMSEAAPLPVIYMSYTTGSDDASTIWLGYATLNGAVLSEMTVIFQAQPARPCSMNYGGRIAFLGDATIAMAIGDGFASPQTAQDLTTHLGKIVRLKAQGGIPANNPFVTKPNAKHEIYSVGHRNPTGLFFDSKTLELYELEQGPDTGDEINIIEPGGNYGWPLTTHGADRGGAWVSPFKTRRGVTAPMRWWQNHQASSGLTIYRGQELRSWSNLMFVGSLAQRQLLALDPDEKTSAEAGGSATALPAAWPPIVDVRSGPDGNLYVVTDDGNNGEIWRISAPPR